MLYFIILVSATASIVHLLVADVVLAGFRRAVGSVLVKSGPGRWLLKLLSCPWCASVYVAALVVYLDGFDWFQNVALVLAIRMLAAIVVDKLGLDRSGWIDDLDSRSLRRWADDERKAGAFSRHAGNVIVELDVVASETEGYESAYGSRRSSWWGAE